MSNEYEQEVSEDSMAMDSLKPGSQSSGPDPKSKIEHMNAVLATMHGMKRDDLTKWFHDAMALIGKEARNLPGSANVMGNENSIRAKPSYATGKQGPSANDPMVKLQHNTPGQSMREDVEEMFEGQDLSEEFKEKASTLFEAAVNLRAMTEIVRLEEEYETKTLFNSFILTYFDGNPNEIKQRTFSGYLEKYATINELTLKRRLSNGKVYIRFVKNSD